MISHDVSRAEASQRSHWNPRKWPALAKLIFAAVVATALMSTGSLALYYRGDDALSAAVRILSSGLLFPGAVASAVFSTYLGRGGIHGEGFMDLMLPANWVFYFGLGVWILFRRARRRHQGES